MVRNLSVSAGDTGDTDLTPGSGISLVEERATHFSIFQDFPGKSHGQRSLMGYSPWDRKELVMAKQLSTHAHGSFSHIDKKVIGLDLCKGNIEARGSRK